jgi:uncharacterized protein YbjT (DUF2867 family)
MSKSRNPRTAMVFGANGLVGYELIQLLLDSNYYLSVLSVTRKPMNLHHDRLIQIILDYDRLDEYEALLGAEDVYCCLGTTMKSAGSKEAFKRVDYDYTVRIAQICAVNHTRQFLLVSSLGADPKSTFFYSKIKGETERAISKIPFRSTHIFQPSILLGKRNEARPGEEMAKKFTKALQFLLVGNLRKYRAIPAKLVAEAMFKIALKEQKGLFTYRSDEIEELISA